MFRRLAYCFPCWILLCFAQAHGQTVQDLINRLNAEQKQTFEEAMKAFNAADFSSALAGFKNMLAQLPGDAMLAKFASEAALNCGQASFAMTALKPIADADANDWQAAALLTRACAEAGDTACRDAGMAHMIDLYRHGVTPKGMQQYILERVKEGDDTLLIRTSLEPWGMYKVYDLAQVLDREGKIFLRITLESGDADQALFAQQHPKEAAAGLRGFTLDAYRETGLNSSGQRTQTHYTYKFFEGQPPYATIRDEFIKIANGKSKPLTSRTNLIVQ